MNTIITLILGIAVYAISCKRFPTKQLFPFMTVTKSLQRDLLCSVGKNLALCDCSRDCMIYQTCCIDYMWDVNATQSLSTYIEQFLSEAKRHRQLKCTPIVSGLTDKNGHKSVNLLMIPRCPRSADRKIKIKCKQNKFNLNLLPVVGSDKYVYKNKHCAVCNGIHVFQHLKVKADCQDKITRSDKTDPRRNIVDDYYRCTFNTEQMDDYIRTCNTSVISKCARSNRDKKTTIQPSINRDCRLCKSYNAGINTADGSCCKNPHCCRDRFRNGNISSGQPDICLSVFPFTANAGVAYNALPRYSILMTYKNAKELQDESTDRNDDVICPAGYTQVGTRCEVDAPKDLVYKPYSDVYETKCLDKNVYIIVREGVHVRRRVLKRLDGLPPGAADYKRTYENKTHLIIQMLQTNYANVSDHLKNDFDIEVIKTSVPFRYENELYGVDFLRNFKGSRICVSPVLHKQDKFNISSNCYIMLNKSVLSMNDYILFTTIKTKTKRYLVTCNRNQFHLSKPCLYKQSTIRNYTILPNKNLHTNTNATYTPTEYEPLRNGIRVCVTSPQPPNMWKTIVEAVEGYITSIGCVCSIIAYIWIIATYSLIEELRTIPGKNIICLCSMLMACDILMLCSMVSVACKYIAILLHYFALAVQFWSVVTAFDIWSTFQGKTLSRNNKSTKRFLCYCVVGWASPLLFVLLSITLEITNIADVGYGKYGVCWITNLPARIVTYIMPVGLMTFFTISILAYTLNRIYRQCNKSKTLLKKRGGDNVSFARMTLKLVLLLGGIEVVGFLQFGDNDINWIFTSIFQLIYTIVRSFRGVFVWLLYIVTDRVFKIYRNLREQRSYREQTKLTSISSTGRTRTYSTKSSDIFNTTLTIGPSPTPL